MNIACFVEKKGLVSWWKFNARWNNAYLIKGGDDKQRIYKDETKDW